MTKKVNPLGQALVFLVLSPVWLVIGTFWLAGILVFGPFWLLYRLLKKHEEVVVVSDRDASGVMSDART